MARQEQELPERSMNKRKDTENTNPESSLYANAEVELEVRAALVEAGLDADTVKMLEIGDVPENFEGDYGIQCAKLAKIFKKSPAIIAKELADKLNANVASQRFVERYVATGPYLNFMLKFQEYGPAVAKQVLEKGDNYGKENIGHNERVVIDMSAPNIAKKMSVGHLRSTIIGDSLARTYDFLGFDVIKDNHIGDWGTQFGHLLYAIELWGDESAIEADPINQLKALYVRISTAGEGDKKLPEDDPVNIKAKEVKDAGRAWFKRLENGDPEARTKWKKIVDWSLKEFQDMYDILGVDFDVTLGESFYEPMLADTIKEVADSGKAEMSKGALIFNLEDEGKGVAIVQKSDGATLYMTRDLAGAKYRQDTLKADRMIYVVGEDQKHYFEQLFLALKKLGYPIADKSVHVYFGMVTLPEGKMSTRKGRTVDLEDVVAEARVRSAAMISERTKTSNAEREKLVDTVAIGALKWNDLSQDPRKGIVFDWDTMLDLKGNSAPYVQYTFARALSLVEKSPEPVNPTEVLPIETDEKTLVKELAGFPDAIKKAADTNTPAAIAVYLYKLAQTFNGFYHNHTVLGGNDQERKSRVALSAAVAQTIKNGLYLLGIEAPNKM